MDILEAFISYPENYMSLNAIAKRIERAYPQVHSQAKRMIEEKILTSMPIGRSIACTPNMNSPLAVMLMGLSQARKAENYFNKNENMRQIIDSILSAIGNEKSSIILSKSELYILTDIEQKKIIENYANEIVTNNNIAKKAIRNVICEPFSSARKFRRKEAEFTVLHGYEAFFSYWGDGIESQ
jgi:hypothetical protein